MTDYVFTQDGDESIENEMFIISEKKLDDKVDSIPQDKSVDSLHEEKHFVTRL